MIALPLTLRLCGRPVRGAAAWFIPGANPAVWLTEIARWDVPMKDLRLHVLPRSIRDRRPCGVLVVAPSGTGPRTSVRALAYGVVEGRLYLPVDARPYPELTETDVAGLLPGHMLVLHPAAGLVGIAPEDVLRPHDLLAKPTRREAAWNCAHPGVPEPPRLTSVEPATVHTVEEVLREGQDDAGSKPLEDLPAAPGEPAKGPVADFARRIAFGLARGLRGFAQHAIAGGAYGGVGGRAWLQRLRQWSEGKMSGLLDKIEASRHRELMRLMHLLGSDPDEGLRYAIPLNSLGSRGVAPRGGQLVQRPTDFDMKRLGGGRPADSWTVPLEMFQSLVARYREAALRSLRLGRHRRAAYIYAELLGDFAQAASVLRQGKHFREAAALFRDHLKKPLLAAECLEEGGLILEAIDLYKLEKKLERVGDLYDRIGQRAAAEEAYRAEVAELCKRADLLAAARLLDQKLRDPEAALKVLAEAWPGSEQAGLCLRARIDMLGGLGRHNDASNLVASLRNEPLPAGATRLAAEALARAATIYPDRQVRRLAADTTRVVVGRRLAVAGPDEAPALLQPLAELAPEDHLLRRDCRRFAAASKGPRSPEARSVWAGWRQPTPVRTFRLPAGVTWGAVASLGEGFCVAGTGNREVVVVQGLWDGRCRSVRWSRTLGGATAPVMAADPEGRLPVLVSYRPRSWLKLQPFPRSDAFPQPLQAGPPPSPIESPLGMAYCEIGLVWVARANGTHVWLQAFMEDGVPAFDKILATLQVPVPAAVRIVPRREHAYATVGPFLIRISTGLYFGVFEEEIRTCSAEIVSLVATPVHAPMRLAALFKEGGWMFWGDDWGRTEPFGMDLGGPAAAFTADGALVVVGAGEGRVYRVDEHHVVHRMSFSAPAEPPLAVLAGDRANEFAAFTTDGTVQVFRLPAT